MKIRGRILLFVFAAMMIFAVGVFSQEDEQSGINEAVQCLDDEINKAPSLTFEEAVFASYAGSTDSRVLEKIEDSKSSSEDCWPSEGCKIRDTAQVAISKLIRGQNADAEINWMKNRTGTPTELIWYLQITIDDNQAATCKVGYGGNQVNVNVNSDLTLSGDTGSCLTIDNNGYWLRISNNCVEETFSVGCDWEGEGSFISNLVYREESDGTTFVSSNTKSSANHGIHEQKISAKCFKSGAGCDYEASLWATTAINKAGESITEYLPYLLALSDSNSQYFPSAFLYPLVSGAEREAQWQDINGRASQAHWDVPGGYNKFIDTGLAMIALKSSPNSGQLEDYGTIGYLLSQQTPEGCWNNNNIRDTAFIIYAAEWKFVNNGGGGGGPPGIPDGENNESGGGVILDPDFQEECESEGYYCVNSAECFTAGGQVLDARSASCSIWADVCCTILPPPLPTCASIGGDICAANEECTSAEEEASDGACCVQGICALSTTEPQTPTTPTTPTTPGEEEDSSLWIWIVLLVVLIGLVVLAIVYKDKLRLWWHKRRGNVKSSRIVPGGAPPMTLERRPPPRFGSPAPMMVPRRAPPVSRAPARGNPKDKEMEDTLKKLKEMSG